jgi:hypothetical protein
MSRKHYAEDASSGRSVGQLDAPAVRLGDTAHDSQAEPGPVIRRTV